MTRRKVVLSAAASNDVSDLLQYTITVAGIEVATELDTRIDNALATLDRFGDRGRVVPELQARGISIYRELLRGTYRIVYRVMGDEVWVLAIVDGRRDLDTLLYERARR